MDIAEEFTSSDALGARMHELDVALSRAVLSCSRPRLVPSLADLTGQAASEQCFAPSPVYVPDAGMHA